MSELAQRYEREPNSAPGDFYVEHRCCASCGVPQMVAPDLVGWTDEAMSHCHWKKQPETAEEMRQAFAIFDVQELGCHRYAGSDPDIQKRIGEDNCDAATPVPRDRARSVEREVTSLLPMSAGWLERLCAMFRWRP